MIFSIVSLERLYNLHSFIQKLVYTDDIYLRCVFLLGLTVHTTDPLWSGTALTSWGSGLSEIVVGPVRSFITASPLLISQNAR